MTEREFAIEVVRCLRQAGHQALWAGGCVRDELLGLVPKDYDIATDALPEEVARRFRRTLAVGASFGVMEVLGPRTTEGLLRVQVATFRSDVSYSDGRHPDRVVFSTPREDAERRDFTINGMFFDPLENRLLDFVGGQEDLEARLLRAIGDPIQRFTEDKLRMLRAVRIASRFDLTIHHVTAGAIEQMAPGIAQVSAERIADEVRKLLTDRHRSHGVNLLLDLKLLETILPELLLMRGLPQGPPAAPTGDLWDHVLRVLEFIGDDVPFSLAFGALLHDVGKPRVVGRTPDKWTFYHHEHVGSRIAAEICQRLRLSTAERDRVAWLVEKHQYLCNARDMRPSKLKTILAHPGVRDLLRLHRADAQASGRDTSHVEYCEELLRRWTAVDLNPPPLLTGHDLQRLGLEPGVRFKVLLDAIREAQLDGTIQTSEEALKMVQGMSAD